MTTGRLTVAIVIPLALRRAALAAALNSLEGIEVVAEVGDVACALHSLATARPDVVVLELHVGTQASTTFDLCRVITTSPSAPQVLVVTDQFDPGLVPVALRAGAVGVFDESLGLDVLGRALRSVHRGEAWLSRAETGMLLRLLREARPAGEVVDHRLGSISPRELEIVQLMADGLDHTAIAEQLFLSPHTTRTHIRNTLKKLGAHNRLDAVRIALDAGLVRDAEGSTAS